MCIQNNGNELVHLIKLKIKPHSDPLLNQWSTLSFPLEVQYPGGFWYHYFVFNLSFLKTNILGLQNWEKLVKMSLWKKQWWKSNTVFQTWFIAPTRSQGVFHIIILLLMSAFLKKLLCVFKIGRSSSKCKKSCPYWKNPECQQLGMFNLYKTTYFWWARSMKSFLCGSLQHLVPREFFIPFFSFWCQLSKEFYFVSVKLGEVSQNAKKYVPMEKTMYFWRARPMQMHNRGADKLWLATDKVEGENGHPK